MEIAVYTDEKGRNYDTFMNASGMMVTIGPPEGLIDSLKLPEPFATNLHNALHRRKILNYRNASAHSKELMGALQEALLVDVQRLNEAYFLSEQEFELGGHNE